MSNGQAARMGMAIAPLAGEVIASYEARIASVEQITEASHEMLEAFRAEREAMRARLQEALARSACLRRRDFDGMMQGILSAQEGRAVEVRETMRAYLQEQRTLAVALKEALVRADAEQGSRSSAEAMGALKGLLVTIRARQEEHERAVRDLLAEFRMEQEEVAETLGGLLANGRPIGVKEFKATLKIVRERLGTGMGASRRARPWRGTGLAEGWA